MIGGPPAWWAFFDLAETVAEPCLAPSVWKPCDAKQEVTHARNSIVVDRNSDPHHYSSVSFWSFLKGNYSETDAESGVCFFLYFKAGIVISVEK